MKVLKKSDDAYLKPEPLVTPGPKFKPTDVLPKSLRSSSYEKSPNHTPFTFSNFSADPYP